MGILRSALVLVATMQCVPALASFHTFQINEIYSSADGSIQFIELRESIGASGQQFLMGHSLTSTQGGTTHTFVFPADLPGSSTANTTVLIATAGFAALGIVAPDYIMPDGFLFVGGGMVDYAGVDSLTYSALPTDGTNSLNRDGTTGVNSPRDFAGQTGSIPGSPPPPDPGDSSAIPLFDPRAVAGLILLLGLAGAWEFRLRRNA